MIRSKSCGLLLVLFTIFGLSLSVCSDTNALKYSYNTFPLYSPNFYFCDTSDCSGYTHKHSQGFSIYFGANSTISYDSDLVDMSKSAWERCTTVNPLDYIWTASFSNSYQQFTFNGNHIQKLILGDPSVPDKCFGQATRWDYDAMLPAEYNMANGQTIKLVSISTAFFELDDPYSDSGSIKMIKVPLNLSTETFDYIPSGTVLEWDLGLVSHGGSFDFNGTLDPNLVANMDISYFTSPSSPNYATFFNSYKTTTTSPPSITTSPSCSIDFNYRFSTFTDDEWDSSWGGFNVHCTYTAPSDLYYVMPLLTIRGSGSNSANPSVLLEYDSHGVYFTGSYLVTNNDPSWSGQSASPPLTGEQIEFAPGYHQIYGEGPITDANGCLEYDYFCKLEHLFDFHFVNPFETIFTLFLDQDQCVGIPTLRTMLHSNETKVCPFFDSTTRSITTPVLSIVASMLLFGFVVRWLGASSGNMFEDQTSHKWGNYQFKQKGG